MFEQMEYTVNLEHPVMLKYFDKEGGEGKDKEVDMKVVELPVRKSWTNQRVGGKGGRKKK